MRKPAPAPLSRYPLDRLGEASVHRQESFPKGPGRFATAPPTAPPQLLPSRARFRLSAGRRRWRAESREAMLPRHAGLTRSFSGPHTRTGSGGGAAELQGVGPTRPGLVRPRQCVPGATPTLALAPLRLTLNAPASFVTRRDPRPPAESGQARIAIGAGPTRGCSGRRKGHGPRGSPGAAEPPAVRPTERRLIHSKLGDKCHVAPPHSSSP